MSRIYLIRHGESVWNAERRLQGQADPDLSATGREQARSLAPSIAGIDVGAAICSDLRRASQTAELLGLNARADPNWREIDVGDWQGRNTDELRADDPERWRAWRAGRYTLPGGEAWPDFRARLSEALAHASDDAIVVTHGGVIRAVTALFLDLSPDRLAPVPPASVTILDRGEWPRLRGYGLGAELGRASTD